MRKNQQGASYIGILVGIIAAAFLLKIIVAVWPLYWDDNAINKQIAELVSNSPNDITPTQFSSKIGQKFDMNNIRDVKFEDIAKVSTKDGLQVTKKYEVRKPFMLNIDLVLTFEKSFDKRSVESK
ncbi:DUF4845 domain-containing protein [Acinetobacter wuhouensis]|uniref:DUF4845 domain-containing protein n=1 Tax=Acinetobacter wuhouensis TaxID=1879050 RepID=A0A4Q7AKK7_9GAMM|nr:DUF4845 domain-containing protein [Acinetobacter wuhouensis]RZG49404.1 DUF4845 domain-containing protein [Acinetobacter wuhouensis]RZG68911.1 DUF4845 domain-containing protein [Acinetobacter wuhouensis]